MSEKGVDATKAGTHLTGDTFKRYIQRDETERRATAALIESLGRSGGIGRRARLKIVWP